MTREPYLAPAAACFAVYPSPLLGVSCDTRTVDGKLPRNFMYESFSRLSQAIKDASESADPEAAKARAAVAVNSIGVMSQSKRERSTTFDQAVNLVADKIQAARGAKLARARSKETAADKPEAKTLAQLLVEAQDSE